MGYSLVRRANGLLNEITNRYLGALVTDQLLDEINQYAQSRFFGDYEITFDHENHCLCMEINSDDPKLITWLSLL
jgi:hypothetical protein